MGLWKLNNSLLQHENIFYGLNNYIKKIQTRDPDNGLDERMRRDFLKYYIRKFSVALPKSLKKNQKIQNLENKMKVLEKNIKYKILNIKQKI